MSSNGPGPRPPQVTIGGWVIAVASAMLVARVYDGMSGLRSVDTRDSLTEALRTGVAKGLDLTVDDALSVLRVGLYVAGVAAVVTGILGIFVLQRHATARVVLTVAAVPVVLTAPLAGGFLGLLIGGATVLLWSPPARDWVAGRAPRRPQPRSGSTERSTPDRWSGTTPTALTGPAAPPAPDGSDGPTPPPTPGWGAPGPATPIAPGPPYAANPAPPYAAPGHALPPAVPWGPRGPAEPTPVQVRVACILTWVFAGLTGGLYVLVGLALAADRGAVLDKLHDNASVRDANVTDTFLVAVVVAVSALLVLWCLAAAVLAMLTWRRHAWAWILLLVSTGATALACLLVLPFSVANLVGAGTAFALLLRPPVRAWFRDGARPLQPPPGSPAHPASPPPPDAGPSSPPYDGKPPVW
jgi:hypothetical protein